MPSLQADVCGNKSSSSHYFLFLVNMLEIIIVVTTIILLLLLLLLGVEDFYLNIDSDCIKIIKCNLRRSLCTHV
jgi:hypothetical protein